MVDTDATRFDFESQNIRRYTNAPFYYRLSSKSPKNRELGTLSSSDASIFLFRRDFALNLDNRGKTWNEHSDFEEYLGKRAYIAKIELAYTECSNKLKR